eukprot:TRINITY_DN2632_c0_g1_i1.p1 TRINITY_DN2632_c0_g1~~TRINITY_DN2632_c0_g1_i1.p1  ORF type:complete len:92 (+),score=4.82 TRINITY_DN2632_c0_g1_i1:206-481(+)
MWTKDDKHMPIRHTIDVSLYFYKTKFYNKYSNFRIASGKYNKARYIYTIDLKIKTTTIWKQSSLMLSRTCFIWRCVKIRGRSSETAKAHRG